MSGQMQAHAALLVKRIRRNIYFLWRHHGPVFLPRGFSGLLRGSSRPVRRVALVIKGKNAHPATAHIRVLRAFRMLGQRMSVDSRAVTAAWLLNGGAAQVDAVLVQRDALPPEMTNDLIDTLRSANIPLIYEIDDWLWNLPADHLDHGIKEAHKGSMQQLARAAAMVTVSTGRLAEILQSIGCTVTILPNGLDETIWADPLPASFVEKIGKDNGLMSPNLKLLYMGTISHSHDLQLIFPAVERLRQDYPDLEIIQIGGGALLPGARDIAPPEGEYPEFVRWFRAVCSYMTMAIAPLRDNEFNSAKSDIKTLDYGFGLVPAIYSNVGPYADSVLHGVTGLLCENTADGWHGAMDLMLRNEAMRSTIKANALENASHRRLSAEVLTQWEDILTRLFSEQSPRPDRPLHQPLS
jgi:glycosyltransferase involved in cell wall biosynthesis